LLRDQTLPTFRVHFIETEKMGEGIAPIALNLNTHIKIY
jgi:hypothetical protein